LSSRAALLKESLDQLLNALRIVDAKYQSLSRQDTKLEKSKHKIESERPRLELEYHELMGRIQTGSQAHTAYDKYKGVLDIATDTVGKITKGLQGIAMTQLEERMNENRQ